MRRPIPTITDTNNRASMRRFALLLGLEKLSDVVRGRWENDADLGDIPIAIAKLRG